MLGGGMAPGAELRLTASHFPTSRNFGTGLTVRLHAREFTLKRGKMSRFVCLLLPL